MNHYLGKPYSEEELLQLVRSYYCSAGGGAGGLMQAGARRLGAGRACFSAFATTA